MEKEHIVITGTGIITSLGAGKQETLKKLLLGEKVIGPIRYLKTKHREIPVGEVPYSDQALKQMINYPEQEKITRTSLLGRVAIQEALEEAKVDVDVATAQRIAFINGNTVGGMEKSEIHYNDFQVNDDYNEYIAMHDCGACTDLIAKQFGGKFEVITTISTACSSAANAIILGANLIREGKVDMAVVGGTECLSTFHLNGFNTLMILDREACRPFDANRHGLNLGEGAAYLVIETESGAKARGVEAICQLSGYGNACDAFHQTATSPNGEGAYLAMSKALETSGLKPSDIDYINAHGTGTGNNDECEGIAMMRLFETVPPVSSTKSYTGHTTSAAGGVESVISILALRHHFIPANLNYETPIEQHNFQPVKTVIKNVPLKHILTNSFGFGGNDSSCVFSVLDTATKSLEVQSTNRCYIQAISHISIQQPLTDEWFENPIVPTEPFNESIEPNYSNYFAPMAARRMGKLQKRATATAVDALAKGQIAMPEAIITGTGLGCIDNTEKFLTAMIANDEEFLQPTFFMQSTHNTISSQVALHLKCHGYNCTYSHRGTSFDSSLFDAFTQIRINLIHNALVGAQDEMTPAYFKMLEKIGYWKPTISEALLKRADSQGALSGSCSLNMLISNQWQEHSLCCINAMDMLYQPTLEDLRNTVNRQLSSIGITTEDISAIVLGLSGDQTNDAIYHNFANEIFPEKSIIWFKHIFGESFSASSFGVYAGALALKRNIIPAHLLYNCNQAIEHLQHILVYNHFQNKDHSLILLSKC